MSVFTPSELRKSTLGGCLRVAVQKRKKKRKKKRRKKKRYKNLLVSWCFKPSQPQQITSGLRGTRRGSRRRRERRRRGRKGTERRRRGRRRRGRG